MAANNYYLGLKQGDEHNIDKVQQVTSANAGPGNGSAADVEVRIQTDAGSGPSVPPINCKDVVQQLLTIIEFIEAKNPAGGGATLPAL